MINKHCSDDVNGLRLVEGEDGEYQVEIPMARDKKKIPDYYGFSKGRHSGSFFLKIGAGIFCFGHLIHMGLILIRKMSVYFDTESDKDMVNECIGGADVLVHDVLYPVFSFLQLYVIYKFGNVIVNKNKALARFAFMHCIGASLCFWIYTIKNETLDSLNKKLFKKYIKKDFKKYYSCQLLDRFHNDNNHLEDKEDDEDDEDDEDECYDEDDDHHYFNSIANLSSCDKENQPGRLFQGLVET